MRRLLVLVVFLSPGHADAHAFTTGQDAYALFMEGASLPFHTPELSLALVALALLIGLWDVDGMPSIWPFLMLGGAGGLVLASTISFDTTLALYGLALAMGLLAAFHGKYSKSAMRALTALASALIADGALALHTFDDLPLMMPIGIFAGLNFSVAAIAGLVSLPQRQIAASWPVIGLRVVASWLVAITTMMLAFVLR